MLKNTILFLLVTIFSTFSSAVFAQDAETILNNKINEYTQKIEQLSKAKDTLNNQISILNSQIDLTLLKINQTESQIKTLEKEIDNLIIKINTLDISLNRLSSFYINQIVSNYKLEKHYFPLITFILSDNFNSFLNQYKYISTIQKNSQIQLLSLETVRTDFDQQKNQKEKKQQELTLLEKKLSDQKINLANQKNNKSNLLEITKNDETRYQKLKKDALSELESLRTAVFDGKKSVKKGDQLGIMGNTGYSFGEHLHFGLYDLTENQLTSFEYAKDIDASDYLNNHPWPMKNYTITQARGHTKYSSMYPDNFHHGLDMYSEDKVIYATDDGIAYFFKDQYPNQKVGGGNHIKLFHVNGKMTLYFHLQKFFK